MKRLLFLITAGLAACMVCTAQTAQGSVPFHQEGIASWYGEEFAGRPTASGEIFDPSAMTAAHPSLPFGTMLRVTNTHNNKSVNVRVNDRGPFVAARILDLSRAAAEQLDMIVTGTAPVMVDSIAGATLSLPQGQSLVQQEQSSVQRGQSLTQSSPIQPEQPQIPAPEIVYPVEAVQSAGPASEKLPELPADMLVPAAPVTIAVEPEKPLPPDKVPVSAVIEAVPAEAVSAGPARVLPQLPEPGSTKVFRIQVGSYKIARNAVEAFDKIKNAGLAPAYERNGEYYRVVLAGIKAAEVESYADILGKAGFKEVLIREER